MTNETTDTSHPGEPPRTQAETGNAEPTKTVAVAKHARATRWTHWINGPLLLIMIWSGLRIYWADVRDPFGFGVGLIGWHWFDFLPDSINELFGLERRLARGMAFHFTFGWLFALNGLIYGIHAWRTGHWRHLVPERDSLRDAVQVLKHDLTLGRAPLPPQGRYNAAQRLTYTGVIAMGAGAILTGIAIYKPTQANLLTTMFGGYESARTIHFAITIGFLAFFAVHMIQVARAGWRNFAAMVTGYEIVEQSTAPDGVPTLSPAVHRNLSRRSALTGTAAVVAGALGWRALLNGPESNNIPTLLRTGHEANEALWRRLSDRPGAASATAPTFDRSQSSILRVNGRHGIESDIDLDAWQLTVLGPDGETLGTHTLDDIRALPKVEYTVEHKCIEGWSHTVTWGGARFSDFAAGYTDALGADLTPFVGAVTPDGQYYVSVDMASMLNPQMLLAYELEGKPLDLEHGAPLRLATPNKYGIKCLKRIGTLQFASMQTEDYWFERGYDWYAQL